MISVIIVAQVIGLKNPCSKKAYQEFFPHPESEHYYIQCSKRGDMYLKECTGDKIWSTKLQKCDESESQSQIKTLANRYKMKQLLAVKKTSSADTTTPSTVSKPEQIIAKEKALENLEIENRNIIHEMNGEKQIDGLKKEMMAVETEQLKDMITKQAEINRQNVHRTAAQKLIEEIQLQKQRQMLELLNRQGQVQTQNVVEQQRIREKDLLDQQVENMEFMIQKNKNILNGIVKDQRVREKAEIEEQKKKQQELLLASIKRREKEREMCSRVSCPSGFRCALDEKDNETLICLHA